MGLNEYAKNYKTIYPIAARCGVFAKTDIQPLINQGAAKEDIALSTFHAVAKQTIGGLAQGLDIIPPVIFEGGPLTFNPTLISVFEQRLGIGGEDAIIPESPETIVARGAALSLQKLFGEDAQQPATPLSLADAKSRLEGALESLQQQASSSEPFFTSDEELATFRARHQLQPEPAGPTAFPAGSTVPVYLGIDSGSTTTKFALIDEESTLVDSFYANNEGEPLEVAQQALIDLDERWRAARK